MSFFSNLFKAATPTEALNFREAPIGQGTVGVPASTTDTTDYAKKQLEGHGGSFEENIVPVQSPRMALAISAVYRAIELRAKTIGQMQLQYQRLDREGGNFVMDVSNSDRYQSQGTKINYLLQVEPNPITTAATLWEQVTIDRLQRGNGFVYIERDTDTDEPIALWRATCGGYNMGLGTYNLTWFSDRGERSRANIPARDVLHFPNTFKEENGFWGIPTLRYAFDTLTLIKTQKAQALENAAKGGRVKLLISEGADSTVAPISAEPLAHPEHFDERAGHAADGAVEHGTGRRGPFLRHTATAADARHQLALQRLHERHDGVSTAHHRARRCGD